MISYRFEFEDGKVWEYEVDIHREYHRNTDLAPHSFWTELSYHQCQNCPFLNAEFSRCPAAVDLEDIISNFSSHVSFEKATVSVNTPERTYVRYCDVQQGLSSLIGLVMATSSCPNINRLRPLAHFHLPFATCEETIFRTVGAYLVKQYLIMHDGEKPDFELEGLNRMYSELVIVNTYFVNRIRAASEKDANLNAVIRHDSFSLLVLLALKDGLKNEKMRFFSGHAAKNFRSEMVTA